ncbi:hypothetical protein GLYMA_18G133300v4 [Glycine max]|uniref:DUF4228 domain-containing protein n=1 Tax=Glycine max TaxID=3847 RepID=K7MRV0_SOYBN|nr:uncharacterized protein LOC100814458 [Glycine max]KAG4921268.1 hypothetical protein JHK86_050081 [Glycine max]KAG5094551.1 hypothetical protein JHK84_050139 [Glycine max]KAH1154367.1 hypothetical protein GYH30_049871 [Glycine max]KRG99257.1 hypothetical protein GLYMA_18G133300v4 [Glycine max]|eukprot:XP_014626775.1 uncharacterized protein LOC100814458 [Glycine max]
MGNCQAVDAAALVIQHPSGKIERLYWPVSASEVMRTNPGHYVSLIIPLAVPPDQGQINQAQKAVLFTRVKLLRPNETLTLGHAYRLVTTQEVVKAVKAKKHAKMRKPQVKAMEGMQIVQLEKAVSDSETGGMLDTGNIYQAMRTDRYRLLSSTHAALKPKSWRPSLQSISESAS